MSGVYVIQYFMFRAMNYINVIFISTIFSISNAKSIFVVLLKFPLKIRLIILNWLNSCFCDNRPKVVLSLNWSDSLVNSDYTSLHFLNVLRFELFQIMFVNFWWIVYLWKLHCFLLLQHLSCNKRISHLLFIMKLMDLLN